MPRRSVSRRRFVVGAGAAGAALALGSAAAAAPTSQRGGISPQAVGELAAGEPAQTPPPPAPVPTQAAPQAAATGPRPPLSDTRDVEFGHRGFIATRVDPMIRNAQGRVVYDLSALDFLSGDAPDTVNPSLWRQSQLLALSGLFRVSDKIWQVRGFDFANTTFMEGDHGWIVIDTLGSIETAQAALDLVNEHLGNRPIVAIIYTHPHLDHFGGAGGMVSAQEVESGQVPIIAPQGFLPAAVSESVIAGPAGRRRAAYQFGLTLPKGPTGQVGLGGGPGFAVGTPSLIAPTREIDHTGERVTIDGVNMVFQLTRNTEAPVELNIAFPDWGIVHMAENVNTTQHNILTPRGAVTRDAKAWADGLTESIQLFGGSDTLIICHGWPQFGQAHIVEYLSKHRDYYAFVSVQHPLLRARLRACPAGCEALQPRHDRDSSATGAGAPAHGVGS